MKTICVLAVLVVAAAAVFAAAPEAAASTSIEADVPASASAGPTELAAASATIAQLQDDLRGRDRRIERLEAKVGMPGSTIGWTWFLIGLIGEGVFFLRFVVQWWASERRKRTVVPMAFWHLSLIGTALVLAYAVFVINPVFILAYSLNIFLYVRNLIIARRSPERALIAEKQSQ